MHRMCEKKNTQVHFTLYQFFCLAPKFIIFGATIYKMEGLGKGRRGRWGSGSGESEESLSLFDEALRNMQEGDLSKALSILLHVLEMDPRNSECFYWLVCTRWAL